MSTVLSLAEAAVVTGLDVKSVNKAVENEVIHLAPSERRLARSKRRRETRRKKRLERLVPIKELLCLQLERELAGIFSLQARRAIIREIANDPEVQEFRPTGAVVIRVAEVRGRLAAMLNKLRRAKREVNVSPDVMNGMPVIKNTRIPVYVIAHMVMAGEPTRDILDGYPGLTEEQVELATLYARAYPAKGRPPKQPWKADVPIKTTRVALTDIS